MYTICTMTTESQKDSLSRIKKALEVRHEKRVTWDEFAEMSSIEPRTLKTYRMPEGSADYRQMPPSQEKPWSI